MRSVVLQLQLANAAKALSNTDGENLNTPPSPLPNLPVDGNGRPLVMQTASLAQAPNRAIDANGRPLSVSTMPFNPRPNTAQRKKYEYAFSRIAVEDGIERLRQVMLAEPLYSDKLRTLLSGCLSAGFSGLAFGGGWVDIGVSFVCGIVAALLGLLARSNMNFARVYEVFLYTVFDLYRLRAVFVQRHYFILYARGAALCQLGLLSFRSAAIDSPHAPRRSHLAFDRGAIDA
jgi:hypothetical protein